MKPFAKIWGVLGAVGVVAANLLTTIADPSVAAVVPAKVTAAIGSICGVIVLLSHSLTGNGPAK